MLKLRQSMSLGRFMPICTFYTIIICLKICYFTLICKYLDSKNVCGSGSLTQFLVHTRQQ
jgi:hypothetical protein